MVVGKENPCFALQTKRGKMHYYVEFCWLTSLSSIQHSVVVVCGTLASFWITVTGIRTLANVWTVLSIRTMETPCNNGSRSNEIYTDCMLLKGKEQGSMLNDEFKMSKPQKLIFIDWKLKIIALVTSFVSN